MKRVRKIYIFWFLIILIALILFKPKTENNVTSSRELSTVELYAHSRLLHINGTRDPPCPLNPNIYVCAGYCPWYNTPNKQLVTCSFLPRIPNHDFVKYNVYCTPHPDHCPTYNAWLKDNLPLTRQPIKQIPDHLLSNFTLNYSIPVDYSFHDFRKDDTWPTNWTIDLIEKYQQQVRNKVAFGSYENQDIYPALEKYASSAIKNQHCAVIGTENPWIEAALLEYNASTVTTIEYATIHSTVPRLLTITPMDFAKRQENENKRQIFDSIWSYSSIET